MNNGKAVWLKRKGYFFPRTTHTPPSKPGYNANPQILAYPLFIPREGGKPPVSPFINTSCQPIENVAIRTLALWRLWTLSLSGDMQQIFSSFCIKYEIIAAASTLFITLLFKLFKMAVSFFLYLCASLSETLAVAKAGDEG